MAIWTINQIAVNTIGVKSASIVYKNAQPDEFSMIIAAANLSDANPYTKGSAIWVRRDGVVVFKGQVTSVGISGSPSEYTFKIVAMGPWYVWEQTQPRNTTEERINNQGDKVSYTTSLLEVDGSTSVATILSVITNAAPTYAQFGSADIPSYNPPSYSSTTMTIAQWVEWTIKFISRYWCWFDYTQSPPRFHISSYGRSGFKSKTINNVVQLDISPADTAIVSAQIAYDRACKVHTGYAWDNANSTTQEARLDGSYWTQEGLRRISTDSAGSTMSVGTPLHLQKNVKLDGTDIIWRTFMYTSGTYRINQLIKDDGFVNYWTDDQRDKFRMIWMDSGWSTVYCGPDHTNAKIIFIQWESDRHPNPQIDQWYRLRTGRPPDGFLKGKGGSYYCVKVQLSITVSVYGTYTTEAWLTDTRYIQAKVYNLIPHNNETISAGAASLLYSNKNTTVNDGRISASADYAAPLNNFGQVVVNAQGSWTCAGVQRLTYDLTKDSVEVQFGQTNLISVDDYVETLTT